MTRRNRKITRLVASFARRDPGSFGRIAVLAGVDRTTVSHWFSEDGERQYAPTIDDQPALIDELGVDWLRPMLEDAGWDITPRARPTTSPAPLISGVSKLSTQVSAILTQIVEAGAEVDEHEAEGIRVEAMRMRAELDAMLARLPRRGAA